MNSVTRLAPSRRPVETADLERAAGSALFRNVDTSVLERLRDCCHVVKLRPSAILIAPSRPNDRLYVVIGGELRVYLDDDRQNFYLTLGVGECVGELSLIDGREASALVVGFTSCELIEIDQDTLWSLVYGYPEIARNLLFIMSSRVRNDNITISNAMRQKLLLEQVANIDGLTGVYNRRWLDEVFPRMIDRCHMTEGGKSALSLVIVDIDHFKHYNDVYGHLVGDMVLRNVAKVLAKSLRPTDLLARYGGEEFAILLLDANLSSARVVANRICKAVAESELDEVDGSVLAGVTLSAGVAELQKGEQLPALLHRADKALYEAKEAGRNRVKAALPCSASAP